MAMFGYVWLKGNLHSHSTNSDEKIAPQERVDGYVKAGYNFLCVSDHHNITRIDTLSCLKEFTLIQGVELHPENPFGGQLHHFLALNMNEDMNARKMHPQDVLDEIQKQGGTAWLVHPYWSSINILRDTMPLHGLAGVEVYNATCRYMARGESSVHWDDWMELSGRMLPAIANDDAHSAELPMRDTYQGWTMVRVKEPTSKTIIEALEVGASYSTSGPEIRDISLKQLNEEKLTFEVSISCSEARRIYAVCDKYDVEYNMGGDLFETATFKILPGAKYVRFEIVDAQGNKAWSNPFDLLNGSENKI